MTDSDRFPPRAIGLPGYEDDCPDEPVPELAEPYMAGTVRQQVRANAAVWRAMDRAGVPAEWRRWAGNLHRIAPKWGRNEKVSGPFDPAPGEVDER